MVAALVVVEEAQLRPTAHQRVRRRATLAWIVASSKYMEEVEDAVAVALFVTLEDLVLTVRL